MTGVKDDQPQPRPTRREKARETHRRILEAALAGFTQRGYGATTMDAVAADADVSVQTVYLIFRTKGDLLQAVYEHVVLGPERTPPHLSAWWRAVEEEADVRRSVHVLVEGTVELLDRAAPLVWAVLGDDTARAGYEFNEGMRRTGTEQLVRILSGKHPLKSGLADDRARDILLLLTGPQLYSQLTRDLKWTSTDVADWVTNAVLRELFDLQPGAAPTT